MKYTNAGAEQGETMYKVIMAPTEGSDSERAAISVAVKLAQRFDADLRLVRVESTPLVIEPVPHRPMLMVPERSFRHDHLARLHKLEALGTECGVLGDIRVITALEEGPVAPTLRDYARKFNVDLIVMSSHSRGGVTRIALGSATDYLIRHTNIPVLVVKPPVSFIGAASEETFTRIVVPLDGSARSELILPEVAALATSLKSTVSLLRVLTPLNYSQQQIMQPGLPWWDTDIATADAYLTRAASYLTGRGLIVSKDVVMSDDVSTAILDYSMRMRADIIAIATSGSGGVSRLVFGSVADEVTRKSTSSLLVFQPRIDDAANIRERSSAETLAGV
jgi:nucleotide-binding universal stress UspA family protein